MELSQFETARFISNLFVKPVVVREGGQGFPTGTYRLQMFSAVSSSGLKRSSLSSLELFALSRAYPTGVSLGGVSMVGWWLRD